MRRAAAALLGVGLLHTWAGGQELALDTVLTRAAAYVSEYRKQLVGIVGEELYRQNVQNTSRGGRISRQFRQMRSDVLLVKLPDEERWLQFRDVFEVDRKPVRDRDERLYKLFVTATDGARTKAETIQEESARHNIGPILRTINLPILALLFLDPLQQPAMKYERLRPENLQRFRELAAPDDVWRIGFTEVEGPTLVRGTGGKDIFSRGELWVDSATGRILETEMVSEDAAVIHATITVRYQPQPGFTLLLPQDMRETYRLRVNESRIDGHATYSKFRQFTVTTTEKPKPE